MELELARRVTIEDGVYRAFVWERGSRRLGRRQAGDPARPGMADRQFSAARLVTETRRRLVPPVLARVPDSRSHAPPWLGLSHPRIDGTYRSTI